MPPQGARWGTLVNHSQDRVGEHPQGPYAPDSVGERRSSSRAEMFRTPCHPGFGPVVPQPFHLAVRDEEHPPAPSGSQCNCPSPSPIQLCGLQSLPQHRAAVSPTAPRPVQFDHAGCSVPLGPKRQSAPLPLGQDQDFSGPSLLELVETSSAICEPHDIRDMALHLAMETHQGDDPSPPELESDQQRWEAAIVGADDVSRWYCFEGRWAAVRRGVFAVLGAPEDAPWLSVRAGPPRPVRNIVVQRLQRGGAPGSPSPQHRAAVSPTAPRQVQFGRAGCSVSPSMERRSVQRSFGETSFGTCKTPSRIRPQSVRLPLSAGKLSPPRRRSNLFRCGGWREPPWTGQQSPHLPHRN
jgi:hypothetical protein